MEARTQPVQQPFVKMMGWVLQVVTERVDTSNLELAKAEANRIGLRMVIDRNNESIVTSDAKCLIAWINNRALIPSWLAAQIVHERHSLLHSDSSVRLEFGHR